MIDMSIFTKSNITADIPRNISVSKFGSNPAVGTSVEDVWFAGGAYTGWLTSADTVRVAAGGNANDTANGTGARSVRIEGLDANWDLVGETVATNGTSASSSTTSSFTRVFRAYVLDCGTYTGTNTGDISIETTGGIQVALIEADIGQTQLSMYTVPRLYTAHLACFTLEVETSNTVELRFFQRQNPDNVSAPFTGRRVIYRTLQFSGQFVRVYPSMPTFPGGTDLWWDAKKVSGGGNGLVDIGYDLILVRD